jgi:lipopolysaccharide heptosyltransferase II
MNHKDTKTPSEPVFIENSESHQKTSQLNKILLIRPRFLGDLILATGLVEVIHQAHPQAEVWFLAETSYAEALKHHPGIAGVIPFDAKRKNNPFYLLSFYRQLRAQGFDTALDLFGNPRSAQMTFWSGAKTRVGFDLRGRKWAYNVIAPPSSAPLPSGRRRVTEAYLDQVRALGIPVPSYKTSLQVSDDEKAYVKKLFDRAGIGPSDKVAVITPGASWPAKRWPLENFIELGFMLQSRKIRPIYIFGPKEDSLAKEFEDRMNKDWIYLNQPSLRGLMAFVEAADVLVSNDSGPMHVGPAVGTPTLGIFGPGEPEVWFPYERPHQILYSEVPCGHCGLDSCPWMTCMDRLTSVDAAKKVIELLANAKKAR